MKPNFRILCALAMLLAAAPLFLGSYGLYLLALTASSCIAIWGLNFVFGYAGQLSLGHAGFVAVGAYAYAICLAAGIPVPLALLGAAISGGVVGLIIGLPALRVQGPYLALVTFGFGEIIRQVIVHTPQLTRGSDGIAVAALGNDLQTYYAVVAVAIMLVLVARRLVDSRVGRILTAMRENELASQAIGLDVPWFKLFAFVLGGLFAGVAGALYGQLKGFIHPDDFTLAQSILFLMVLIVGGAGTFWGPVFGALFLVLLPELLREVQEYRVLIYGCLLLASVLFFPNGIVELIERLATWCRERLRLRDRWALTDFQNKRQL